MTWEKCGCWIFETNGIVRGDFWFCSAKQLHRNKIAEPCSVCFHRVSARFVYCQKWRCNKMATLQIVHRIWGPTTSTAVPAQLINTVVLDNPAKTKTDRLSIVNKQHEVKISWDILCASIHEALVISLNYARKAPGSLNNRNRWQTCPRQFKDAN